MGEWNLRRAFNISFIYGTQGRGSAAVGALQRWYQKVQENKGNKLARTLNLFDPGIRAEAYIKNNYQMMDMYYGQKDNNLFQLRKPLIAEFIHHAMKYKGSFRMEKTGRDAFLETYGATHGAGIEGWQRGGLTFDLPDGRKLLPSQEISRNVRWGIERFGGKLVFEGKWVYYSQVFCTNTFKSDTDVEARDLFSNFTSGIDTAPLGSRGGQLIFNWNGTKTIPTHCHFLSNWSLQRKSDFRTKHQRLAAKTTNDFGGLQHQKENRPGSTKEQVFPIQGPVRPGEDLGSITCIGNDMLDLGLWRKFQSRPAGIDNLTAQELDVLVSLSSE